MRGDITNIIKEVWGSRWVDFVQLEASGTREGVVIMWDKRNWESVESSVGKSQNLNWHLTGVYAPNGRVEREDTWGELGAATGLYSGPWVQCGDFNTTRYPTEKKRCLRINKAMTDFSEFIEHMELRDLELKGGKYTWRNGDREDIAARLDRFLISEELDNCFKNV